MAHREAWFSAIDWQRTRAYTIPDFPHAVWLNYDRARSERGQAIISERDALCSEIAERLYDWCDERTGERVVRNVWKREKIYTGDWSLLAPDLQILWNEEVQLNPQDARIQVAPWKIRGSGDHRLMGTIIACGPPFRSGTEIHGAQVYDIAPTILYLLQQAIPVHLDGRPLIEAFEDTFVHFHPIRVTKSSADAPQDPSGYDLSETDVETIEQRLRGLGYL